MLVLIPSETKVVKMDSKSCAKIDKEAIHMDLQLLFQQPLTAAHKNFQSPATIFKYELCSRPKA